MEITLITPEQHAKLLEIYNQYPNLTLQNTGYQYIDKSKLTIGELEKFQEVTDILKSSIRGFSEFNNFRLSKVKNEIQIRFQYAWSDHFTGVGYLLVDTLLNGFENPESNPD